MHNITTMKDKTMLKGWRTLIFNAVTILVAGVQVVDPSLMGPQGIMITTLVNAFGNMVLRMLTTTPVGQK
jgi:hypothetical protein